MSHGHLVVKKSSPLRGSVNLVGAKNATLPILASLILTSGISTLNNVPHSSDIIKMLLLLEELGAKTYFNVEAGQITVDTTSISSYQVSASIMNSMRASILVMGPLLARFGKAFVALPGGCLIGARPINYHLKGLSALGVKSLTNGNVLEASVLDFFTIQNNRALQVPCDNLIDGSGSRERRIVLEYPSVGATENIMMFATLFYGTTVIVNAALEPEVIDLIDVLVNMGAQITIGPGALVIIRGVAQLFPITHSIIPDRLEAGALLIAASMTGGSICLPNARPDHLDIVLLKLQEMGHEISTGSRLGVSIKATMSPQGVSIKTGPYPSFPTDLQPPIMAALTLATGMSVIEETVFENRLMHITELQKMGAQIVLNGSCATIRGVESLYGAEVLAHDIRGACALVLAGLRAEGQSIVNGLHYWHRAYDKLENKLVLLGASIDIKENN